MAKTPKFQRLNREDFKDAPEWINRLLYWLNLFVEYITIAFKNGITFDDNIQAQIKNFSILAGATADLCTAEFMSTLPVSPRGLLKMKVTQRSGNFVVLTDAVDIHWRYDNGTVFITSVTGLTSGETYDFAVLLI